MWEKILGLVPDLLKTGIPALGGYSFGEWNTRRKWKNDEDANVLKNLSAALPQFRDIEQLFSEKSLTDSFTTTVYHQFYQAFRTTVADPTRHFHDKTLQQAASEIEEKTKDFLHDIGKNTFPTQTGELSIRRLKYGDNVDDMETGQRLNDKADEIFEKYKTFMSLAKKRQIKMP